MNSEEIHLRDYLRVVNKRRGLVAAFFLVTFVCVCLFTFSRTPVYQSSVKVLIQKSSDRGLDPRYGGFPIYDPLFLETQAQVIKSQAVCRRVVRLLDLVNSYASYFPPQEEGWNPVAFLKGLLPSGTEDVKPEVELDEAARLEAQETALATVISAGIMVAPVKESQVIAISFESINPEFATLIANTVARAYTEESLDMKLNSTRLTLAWMTRKAQEEADKLGTAEKKLQKYREQNNIVTLENRLAVQPQELSQIGTKLVTAEADRKDLEVLYSKVEKLGFDSDKIETIPVVASDKALQEMRGEILKAEQNILELSGKYGPKHPVMKKAVADLGILKEKRLQEIKRIIESVRNSYELAAAREDSLRAQLGRVKAETLGISQRMIQYNVLKREVDTNRQLYDALLLKMKEQSITKENQPVNLWVVEKAVLPQAPIKPRKLVNLLLGIVVGLFGGIGLAFFIEYLDNTVKYPEETEKALGLSVLGMVSLWKEKGKDLEKVLIEQPRSTYAENYRALRTAVMLSSAEGAPGKILITSPGAAAGKTTTAANLAIALAQAGRKVVLIDGDMRRPRQHKVFGKSNKYGLSNYLAGGSGETLLQKGPVEGLALITSGPIPPNPAELLSSNRMLKLLDGLEKDFDVILCDSPPLLTVADARIVSRLFDGTMLVVRARQTTFDMAGKAVKSLADVNAPILGMVINALELKKSDYYYQYYYQSYYGEEPEAQEG